MKQQYSVVANNTIEYLAKAIGGIDIKLIKMGRTHCHSWRYKS